MGDRNPNPTPNADPTRFGTQPEEDPIPPDPLLDPGTFIHVDANGDDDVTPTPAPTQPLRPDDDSDVIDLSEVIDGQSFTDLPGAQNLTDVIGGQNSTEEIDGQNLTDVHSADVINGQSLTASESETKKKNSKRLPVELAGRPDWLPDDWRYEIRMRVSGATAGSYDRYYFSPTGKNFRSKAEVLRFMETGSRKKKRGTADETPPTSSEKRKAKRPKRKKGDFSNVDFDFKKTPKNVSWTLTNASHDIWTPVADGVIASESVQRTWDDAFSCVTELEGEK